MTDYVCMYVCPLGDVNFYHNIIDDWKYSYLSRELPTVSAVKVHVHHILLMENVSNIVVKNTNKQIQNNNNNNREKSDT